MKMVDLHLVLRLVLRRLHYQQISRFVSVFRGYQPAGGALLFVRLSGRK